MISTFFEVFLIFLVPADAYRKKLQGNRLKKLQNQETLKAVAV